MTFNYHADATTARLLEAGAEELGRLDSLVAMAPSSVPLLLQASVVARLASAQPQAMRATCSALVAAGVEPVHASALDEQSRTWQQRLDDGERRARSGAPLPLPTTVALDEAQRESLGEALRPGGHPRPVLLRAVHAAAVVDTAALSTSVLDVDAGSLRAGRASADAELLAAILLTAAGTTDRVRLLPFVEFEGEDRMAARQAWLAGEHALFVQGALGAVAPAARRLRVQLRLLLDARAAEDEHLGSIGRAAVTARRALQVLRDSAATSVPDLSARLDCSRPAAGDALERLTELGIAEEITGRGRDRVWVWAAAWGLT